MQDNAIHTTDEHPAILPPTLCIHLHSIPTFTQLANNLQHPPKQSPHLRNLQRRKSRQRHILAPPRKRAGVGGGFFSWVQVRRICRWRWTEGRADFGEAEVSEVE